MSAITTCTSVVDPDPVGSWTFCRIRSRIRNWLKSRIRIQIRIRKKSFRIHNPDLHSHFAPHLSCVPTYILQISSWFWYLGSGSATWWTTGIDGWRLTATTVVKGGVSSSTSYSSPPNMDCKESTRVEDGMSPDPTRTKEAADFRQGRRIPKGRVCQDFKQIGLKGETVNIVEVVLRRESGKFLMLLLRPRIYEHVGRNPRIIYWQIHQPVTINTVCVHHFG